MLSDALVRFRIRVLLAVRNQAAALCAVWHVRHVRLDGGPSARAALALLGAAARTGLCALPAGAAGDRAVRSATSVGCLLSRGVGQFRRVLWRRLLCVRRYGDAA